MNFYSPQNFSTETHWKNVLGSFWLLYIVFITKQITYDSHLCVYVCACVYVYVLEWQVLESTFIIMKEYKLENSVKYPNVLLIMPPLRNFEVQWSYLKIAFGIWAVFRINWRNIRVAHLIFQGKISFSPFLPVFLSLSPSLFLKVMCDGPSDYEFRTWTDCSFFFCPVWELLTPSLGEVVSGRMTYYLFLHGLLLVLAQDEFSLLSKLTTQLIWWAVTIKGKRF